MEIPGLKPEAKYRIVVSGSDKTVTFALAAGSHALESSRGDGKAQVKLEWKAGQQNPTIAILEGTPGQYIVTVIPR